MKCADVAKSADARDLKSLGSNTVPVQFRSAAPPIEVRVYRTIVIFEMKYPILNQ